MACNLPVELWLVIGAYVPAVRQVTSAVALAWRQQSQRWIVSLQSEYDRDPVTVLKKVSNNPIAWHAFAPRYRVIALEIENIAYIQELVDYFLRYERLQALDCLLQHVAWDRLSASTITRAAADRPRPAKRVAYELFIETPSQVGAFFHGHETQADYKLFLRVIYQPYEELVQRYPELQTLDGTKSLLSPRNANDNMCEILAAMQVRARVDQKFAHWTGINVGLFWAPTEDTHNRYIYAPIYLYIMAMTRLLAAAWLGEDFSSLLLDDSDRELGNYLRPWLLRHRSFPESLRRRWPIQYSVERDQAIMRRMPADTDQWEVVELFDLESIVPPEATYWQWKENKVHPRDGES